ncbi:hypothetical protein [Bosea sp. 685]|uniref:hypothetical protein n=1 Tax=Bosea sp. 685 TaxID=3080057 RepID=UPI002892FA52|nr:hypothetical protein [Bosea sp. 685]WNJ89136.1 hypothetical protein RMR04_22350 [Bosea sp. 685]
MKRAVPNPLPQGPQHYWKQMVAFTRQGGFTITEIHKASSVRARSTIKSYVLFCAEQGHIELVGERPTEKNRTAGIYKVCNLRAEAPVQRRPDFTGERGRRCQQLWTAMRALRTFTVRDLAIAAATDTVDISEPTARTYVFALSKAGYLVEIGRRKQRGVQAHWKLMPGFNTGPLCPATTKHGTVVFDRNLGRVVNPNASETTGRAA